MIAYHPAAVKADAPSFYKGKRILVTGGTGSIGYEIVRQLLACGPAVVRVLSRDDTKQAEMQQAMGARDPLRFLIGDVRDLYRMKRAMEGIDTVFHAAALKHVPTCEYNPFEAVQTNAVGTQNVVQAALDAQVDRMVVISTDKAVDPVNTMGASKLLAERIAVAAGMWSRTRLCATRFGNVVGSRGSLVPLVAAQVAKGGPVTVTNPRMTRFMMTIPDAVGLVLEAGRLAEGGEVFIHKMPAVQVGEFVQALVEHFAPRHGRNPSEVKTETIGVRPGEKEHEHLLTLEELPRAEDMGAMLRVHPPHRRRPDLALIDPSVYDSEKADYLSAAKIRALLERAGV